METSLVPARKKAVSQNGGRLGETGQMGDRPLAACHPETLVPAGECELGLFMTSPRRICLLIDSSRVIKPF